MFKRTAVLAFSLGLTNAFAKPVSLGQQWHDFNGFYAALGSDLNTKLSYDTLNSNKEVLFSSQKTLFDGHVGYGKYFNQNMYLGAKTSVYYTPLEQVMQTELSKSEANPQDASPLVKPVYNINAVLGYETLPHLLPFLEAGISFADLGEAGTPAQSSIAKLASHQNTLYSTILNPNQYTRGYNLGIGANYQMRKNWFLSSELIYNYLGKGSAYGQLKAPTKVPILNDIKGNQAVSLQASVSYLFPEN